MVSKFWLIAFTLATAITITPAMSRVMGHLSGSPDSPVCTSDSCGSGACGQLRSLQEWHASGWKSPSEFERF